MKSRKRKAEKNRKSRKFSKKKIAGADNDCPICYTNLDNDTIYTTSCCKKQFHYECLKDWYATKIKNILARKDEDEDEDEDEEEAPTCPMCRKTLEYIQLNKEKLPLNNDQIEKVFSYAVDNNITSIVQNMIDFGANIKPTNIVETPLHHASSKGHPEVVRILLEKGADIEATNLNGDTPLHIASEEGHIDVVKILLEAGADKEARHKLGWTPLILASENGHTDIVELLKNYTNSTTASGKKKRKKKPTKKKRRH